MVTLRLRSVVTACYGAFSATLGVRAAPDFVARHALQSTKYPTTITSIWSSTTSSSTTPGPWGAVQKMVVITTQTVTLLEPHPTSIDSYPATVVQTAITSRTYDYRITYSSIDGPVSTSISSGVYTVPSTWVLHPAEPTDMAEGMLMPSLPCEECTASTWTADSKCAAKGLNTACQGQCRLRDDTWWCYKMYYSDYGSDVQMGRVCWGNDSYYEQLLEPCNVADHRLACLPCKGWDYSWGAVIWLQ